MTDNYKKAMVLVGQFLAEGLIVSQGQGYKMTGKGREQAQLILDRLSPREAALLMLLAGEAIERANE